MNTNVKHFLIFAISLVIVISLMAKINNHNRHETKDYKGEVIKKYFFNTKDNHVEPRAVIYCDSLNKEIDILMDNKTFRKISAGDTISVSLNVKDIILDE